MVRDCNGLTSLNEDSEVAGLDCKMAQIFKVLCREPTVSLQAFLAQNTLLDGLDKGQFKNGTTNSHPGATHLYVNVYGPATIVDSIGTFASKCGLFLQDPQHCDRDVEYRNPHRISFEDDVPVYTQSMRVTQNPSLEIEEIGKPLDLFRDLELEESLAESEPGSAVRTKLYPYVYSS